MPGLQQRRQRLLPVEGNGKYLTVPAGTAKPLVCAKSSIGDSEKFSRSVIGQSG